MNIWLINPYGPIPIPEEKWREYRFTIIGNYLANNGHNVIWYTSSFSHHFKTQRTKCWRDIKISSRFTIRLVPNPGYKKNISFGRLYRDWVFSFKVYNQRKISTKPDLIIYNESPLSFGFAGQKLASYFKIPVVFDQMDLWPELMINSFHVRYRNIVKLFFFPVFYYRKRTYEKLSGFISLAKPYLEIPMEFVPSLKSKPHAVIYNGIDVKEFRNEAILGEELRSQLPIKNISDIWFVFAGTLGPSYDIMNLIDVAKIILMNNISNVKFIVAGDGPLKKELQDHIRNEKINTVTYIGKLKPSSLAGLYSICDVGLSIYSDISNVEMPDKFYDYIAAGLPIINSLKGEVSEIIEKEHIGINYVAKDTEGLYRSVMELTKNQLLRKTMSQNSWELGMSFDKNIQIEKIGKVINAIMKSDSLFQSCDKFVG